MPDAGGQTGRQLLGLRPCQKEGQCEAADPQRHGRRSKVLGESFGPPDDRRDSADHRHDPCDVRHTTIVVDLGT